MKKNKTYIHIIGLLAVILCFNGCTEEVKPNPYTYSKLLAGTTSKTWRLSGVQIIEEGQQPFSFDLREIFPECVIDDLYVFYADKDRTLEILESNNKCNSNNPDILFTDTWSIVNATATINFVFRGFPSGTFTLKNITENSFTTEYYFVEDKFSYRFLFTSQRN